MVKKLTGSYLTNNKVSFTVSIGEDQALYSEAKRLKVMKSTLIKGVLFGDYSVKDALSNAKIGPTNLISHVNVTTKDRDLINYVAWENGLTINDVVRGILYETL